MAWGTGTTVDDAQAYEGPSAGIGGGPEDIISVSVREDNVGFYLDDSVGPTTEFGGTAWYGEDETYGTQADWLTGEGLTTAWGPDPHSAYPSYTDPLVERIAEDPLMNTFVNARGMLRRGGKPGPWDYAALGLSVIPGVGPAAVRMARPYVKNALSAFKRRNPLGSDYTSDQLNTPILKSVKPGEAVNPASPVRDPRMDQAYNSYERTMLGRGEKPLSRSDWDVLPLSQTRQQLLATMYQRKAAVLDVRNMPADEFYAMDTKIQDRLLKNADLTRKDISTIHWVNEGKEIHVAMASLADELGNSALSAEINAAIKTRDKFVSNLSDVDWVRLGLGNRPFSIESEIMQLKPGHIRMTDTTWAGLVEGKTLSEAKDIARKLMLRIID